jgi:hypothetical protein
MAAMDVGKNKTFTTEDTKEQKESP